MNYINGVLDAKARHSLKLIGDAIEKYPKTAVACSFGKDSMVTLYLARLIKPDINVFTVLTPFKPKETFEFKDRIEKEWKLNLKVYVSKERVQENLHLTDPDECCRILKVEPTREAVKDLDCWICGLRNTEGRTRKDYKEVEVRGNLVKLNPILDWTEADVWRFIATHNIPVHPWYSMGYRSLGCACCSTPNAGDNERDGRWKGTSKCGGECGIHTQALK